MGKVTHGLGKPPTYSHWVNMKTRCFNKNSKKYPRYGGRGITICQEWLDFKNFHEWAMSHGFKPGLSIERIDNNGNYEPSNCCWITMAEQAKNKYTNHYITYNGVTDTIKGWTKRLGLKKNTLYARINDYGWPIEKALTTKVND